MLSNMPYQMPILRLQTSSLDVEISVSGKKVEADLPKNSLRCRLATVKLLLSIWIFMFLQKMFACFFQQSWEGRVALHKYTIYIHGQYNITSAKTNYNVIQRTWKKTGWTKNTKRSIDVVWVPEQNVDVENFST